VTPTATQRERHASLTSTPYIALQIKKQGCIFVTGDLRNNRKAEEYYYE
jgi:hypothetical protein